MHIEQKLFTIGLDNDILNMHANITTAPYDSYKTKRLFDYQLTLTFLLKEIITKAFKIEMQTLISEISREMYWNLKWLIVYGSLFLLVIAVLFARKAKEERNAQIGVLSVLKVMQTLPPLLVLDNPSAYYLLRQFLE
jgi:hypothetical protein